MKKLSIILLIVAYITAGCGTEEAKKQAREEVKSEIKTEWETFKQENQENLKVIYHKIIMIITLVMSGYIFSILSYSFRNKSMASVYKISTIISAFTVVFMPYEAKAVTIGEILGATFAPGSPGSFIWKMLALALGAFIVENISTAIGKGKIAQYTNIGVNILALLMVIGLIWDLIVVFGKFVGIQA